MAASFVLILWNADSSTIRQAFGPYGAEAEAQSARDDLKSWPALDAQPEDCWTIVPCTPTAAPKSIVMPTMPYIDPQRQWWQNPIITCNSSCIPLPAGAE